MNSATLNLANKLQGVITDVNSIKDLTAVNGTQLLFGGLNIVYGVDGSGKSYQLTKLISKSNAANVYIDTDGANGKQFVQHCLDNGVVHIGSMAVDSTVGTDVLTKVLNLLDHIGSLSNDPVVVVVDSLTSILEGTKINNAEDISPILYKLNQVAEVHGMALVVVDHATENQDYPDGFKLEGNAGAKRRATVTTSRYVPLDKRDPSKGGTFICERARGNNSNIQKGTKIVISNIDCTEAAVKFFISKAPQLADGGSISSSERTKFTQHERDNWVRNEYENIFNTSQSGRTTLYSLKPKFITQ